MIEFRKNIILLDILKAILFGIVAFILGFIQFNIPKIEGGVSSFNEVALLISILYISNPFYLIIICAISSIGTPPTGSVLSTFIMHLLALIPFWFYYHGLIKNKDNSTLWQALFIVSGVILYYFVFLLPLMIITNQMLGLNEQPFFVFYVHLINSAFFEITATSLIVTFYILQHHTQLKLKEHIANVEEQIKKRTIALDLTIKELNTVNEELKLLNENLDDMIFKRTEELENRNKQLSDYAFVNSHLLRAPLARILGLSNIIMLEFANTTDADKAILMEKFVLACHELDKVVKLLSELISEESILERNQIDMIQERIKIISNDILVKS